MKTSSAKQNFLYQMAYEILAILLPIITSPYVSRVIGAEGLGIYSYSYSIAYYFVLFAMLGIKNYGNRAIARTRDNSEDLNRTFSSLLILHILISLICFVIYLGYILILPNKIYAAIQAAYVLSALFDISWFYFGIEKFNVTVIRSSIVRILNLILILLLVKTENDLWIYCSIMAFCILLNQLLLWVPLKRYVKFVRPKWADIKVHVQPMLILFIPTIAVSLYKYMDKIMLGSISSKIQLGYYENAEKLNSVPTAIISAFGTVMLPRMSNLVSKNDKKNSERYTALSMQFVMCIALAMTFGLIAIGEVFAPVFWGKQFTSSGIIIMGLASTLPFVSFANVIRTQYLIPNQKDNQYVFSVIVGAVVNILVNSLLIPSYGAIGATVGTIGAEITVCLIQTVIVRNVLPIWQYFESFSFFIVIGFIMFVIVYSFGKSRGVSISTLILQIIIGVLFYGVLTLIYFIRTKNEILYGMINSHKK